MTDKSAPTEEPKKYQPGEGIRSMRSTSLFRAVNFELYAKPVSITSNSNNELELTISIVIPEHSDNDDWCDLFRYRIGLHHIHAIQIREPRLLCSCTRRWERSVHQEKIEMGLIFLNIGRTNLNKSELKIMQTRRRFSLIHFIVFEIHFMLLFLLSSKL